MLPQFTEATKGPNGEPGVVIVHVEACTHIHRSLSNIRAMGGSPSVALNPSTPAEAVENVLDLVDHVLVMTVNPGFGGQAYIPTMTDKIEKIRKWIVDRGLDVDIEVDGCVKIKSSRRLRAESSRRPPRHRRDACSMAWRYRFLTARPSQDGRVIAEK